MPTQIAKSESKCPTEPPPPHCHGCGRVLVAGDIVVNVVQDAHGHLELCHLKCLPKLAHTIKKAVPTIAAAPLALLPSIVRCPDCETIYATQADMKVGNARDAKVRCGCGCELYVSANGVEKCCDKCSYPPSMGHGFLIDQESRQATKIPCPNR